MNSVYTIQYFFRLDDGREVQFTVRLDAETLLIADDVASPPAWTRLEHYRCPSCPLDPASSPWCPAAVHLAEPVARFAETFSFTDAEVRVVLPEREVTRRTSVQIGLSSLIGIYMPTSGCPVFAPLRPMARFHLPFATANETIFRAASSYLLGQYFRRAEGAEPDWSLEGLARTYRHMSEVNCAFAARLRSAAQLDASLNALVLLDVFAKTLPKSIEQQLEEIRGLFGQRP